jgi:predicted DNA-binding transcriptional regulator AlpA
MQGIVKAELANHKPTPQIPDEEELLNASETIAFLRVSRPTYQKLRRDGDIKAVAISERRILYRKSDLLAYINSKVN